MTLTGEQAAAITERVARAHGQLDDGAPTTAAALFLFAKDLRAELEKAGADLEELSQLAATHVIALAQQLSREDFAATAQAWCSGFNVAVHIQRRDGQLRCNVTDLGKPC